MVLALSAKAFKASATPLKPVRFDNGVPVYRFRVQAVPTGRFLTADNQPFTVSSPTLKHWTQTFRAFSNRGIPVPVLTGTHLEPTAEHSVGRVVGLDNDGRSLWATVELMGHDAPRLAASNSVSIYAEPEWTDAKGKRYEWPIRHLLLTPDPRIPGLKGFVPLAASNGRTFKVPVLRFKGPIKLNGRTDPEGFREREAAKAKGKERPNKWDEPEYHELQEHSKVPPKGTKAMSGKNSKLPAIGLDDLGMNENGLGVPGVGDGAMLPEGDAANTAGDIHTGGLKEHIKSHFLDKAHTVLDDEAMEHEEKLDAIKELLEEMERIIDAFSEEEEHEHESGEEEPEEDEAEHESGERGAAMSNKNLAPENCGMSNGSMSNFLFKENATLRAANRKQVIQGLFLSGQLPGGKPQRDALIEQWCGQRPMQDMRLALSNRSGKPDADFNSAMKVLSMNPKTFGEKTGPQGLNQSLMLANPYVESQRQTDAQAKEDMAFAGPSSQRAKKK
jgi:hypothetical protein